MPVAAALAAAAILTTAAATVPVTPARDAVVETQLLPPSVKASLRALAAAPAAAAAAADPRRLAQARQLIEAGRATGDPRTLGYAAAMLAPWPPSRDDAPADALVLHATIMQSRHDFTGAKALLDRVIARDPRHAQALLTRATIAQVQGDHASVRRDCNAVRPASPDAAAVCLAAADAATGADDAALASLAAVTARPTPLRGWALSIAGDIRLQRSEPAAAAALYQAALREGEDLLTRVALADARLAQGNTAAALAVLDEAPATDAVLLRRWLALRAGAPAPAADAVRAELAARSAAASARGDRPHAREAAWFALEDGRAAEALALALENWRAQREATDLWLLARSARAAGDAAALAEARAWQQRTRLNDVRLRAALGEPR